ncbi:guanylate kinase [Buchnera aphidicola str. Bp (Baizongia pistaciae)]|uniref:Guanylate kinase n=1 Tax=Buchnera aphidicola subsp. Baizongia pistaciae (strain Bp) TaxID=224915 RepID=KGUA_BUCBP|nr:guanylate kinase [Buchnera aphidicola]Q89AC8.1 RecName: Full=Guanylate kinase; AltName: Full=GMP kinase [Buchnera aphidicola str. Bp (Baizongia pistaciae)]AAO27097.1 guanylate kinase [Buchnera aphidicola str. Bp (Baizongia pistaciae)]
MAKGLLFIVSAPSGTGKSSLIQALVNTHPLYSIKVSVSHTTRIIRPGECHGKHYYFISNTEFQNMIDKEEFLEYAKVFNNYYGTSKKQINYGLSTGTDVFLDIDWQGARQIRNKLPESKSIFILPPSKEELYRRLCKRGQDSDIIIKKRMNQAVSEMKHYIDYDYLIINDNFNLAVSDLYKIIRVAHLSIKHQIQRNNLLIRNLLNE